LGLGSHTGTPKTSAQKLQFFSKPSISLKFDKIHMVHISNGEVKGVIFKERAVGDIYFGVDCMASPHGRPTISAA
jgi:hypothetical protein